LHLSCFLKNFRGAWWQAGIRDRFRIVCWQPFPGILQPDLRRAPLREILPEDDPAKDRKTGLSCGKSGDGSIARMRSEGGELGSNLLRTLVFG
jgi:hypothetical protein